MLVFVSMDVSVYFMESTDHDHVLRAAFRMFVNFWSIVSLKHDELNTLYVISKLNSQSLHCPIFKNKKLFFSYYLHLRIGQKMNARIEFVTKTKFFNANHYIS